MIQKDLIFMEHDGAVDDLLSQLLLMTMEDKEIIGMNVTPADCFLEPAAESTYKILELFHREDIEIGRSDCNGINAFPSEWRARPEIINALPLLINFPKSPNPYNYKEASQLLIEKLMGAPKFRFHHNDGTMLKPCCRNQKTTCHSKQNKASNLDG